MLRGTARVAGLLVVAVCLGYVLGGCSGDPAGPAGPKASEPAGTPPAPTAPPPSPTARAESPSPTTTRITVDDLPPPPDGRFHATVQAVPAGVLARSSWTKGCPVAAADLRYLTVGFRGFDGRAHTGELLVNRRAADDLVTVFRQLFAADFPIERMRISSLAELNAPPTGDGNTTEAFACRPVRGSTVWSQHAYGLAVDLNPFQNPYHKGRVVLPELATAYLDRADVRPGMVRPGGPAVRAFAAIGWPWGGNYRSLKDYMHFSATGG
ncbi:M15 family metallopeptidase [Phytohabitans rumicis]|uniref:M15 family metallopeptidase n=1 Tax=Phytohabitans rumicis TaxID=1076125 RepID=UPI001FE71508|nr:M15 family metallopeptidase [Phytohabitans rumicis]